LLCGKGDGEGQRVFWAFWHLKFGYDLAAGPKRSRQLIENMTDYKCLKPLGTHSSAGLAATASQEPTERTAK
jgi:hypothetical protein